MRRRMASLCVTAGLLAPASATAAPGLTPETVVGPAVPGVGQFVAEMSPGGYGMLAWAEGRRGSGFVVRVSTKPPTGAWTAPETVGAPADRKVNLTAAITDSGAAAVAYGDRPEEGTRTSVFVSSRAPGAAFTPAEGMTERTQSSPHVGIDAAGAVELLYAADGNARERRFSAGTPALAAPPAVLQEGCSPSDVEVAPSGDAIAAFLCSATAPDTGFITSGVRFAQRRGGGWQPPTDVPGSGSYACPATPGAQTTQADPEVAIGSDGDVAASYVSTTTTTDCTTTSYAAQLTVLRGAALTPEAAPVATMTSAQTNLLISGTQLAIRRGGLLVGWTQSTTTTATQSYVRDLPGEPQLLDGINGVELRGGASGHALAVGSGPYSAERIPLLLATRAPGAPFTAPAEVVPGSSAANGAIAVSDAGDGLYAFTVYDGTATTIRVQGYDVSPPLIAAPGALNVAAGRRTTLPVNAVDLFGPVALNVTFGDKTAPATALPLKHRFKQPGRYSVVVNATDALGNASAATVLVRAVRLAKLSRLSVTPGRARRTVRLRYRLDRSARVRITLQQRVGRSYETRQKTTRKGKKGANRATLRIKRRKAGRYRVLVRPFRGGIGGKTRRANIRVVRR